MHYNFVPWGIYAQQALENLGSGRRWNLSSRKQTIPQCAYSRFARRSQVRHRLCDERQSRSQGESGLGREEKTGRRIFNLESAPDARDQAVVLFCSDRKNLTCPQTIRSRFCSVLDLVRSPGTDEVRDLRGYGICGRHECRVHVMYVPARDGSTRVPRHCGNGGFGEAKVISSAGETVTQHMRCNTGKIGILED